MWLVVYEKAGKRFHNFQEKLSEPFKVLTENMEQMKLTSQNRIAKFKVDTWKDLYAYLPNLKKFKLQMFVSKNTYFDHTEIGFHIFMLNNPVRNILLCKTEEKDEAIQQDERKTSIYMTGTLEQFLEAEKEFGFTSEIKKDIWG